MSHLKKLRSIAWTLGSGVCRQSRQLFTFICCKIGMLEEDENERKRGRGWPI